METWGKQLMKNNRISTTISSKHRAMLLKLAEKHGSQQKALEYALDSLENDQRPISRLSPEEEKYARKTLELNSVCIINKDALKILLENMNQERIMRNINEQAPMQYVIEYHVQKPLKECGLKEIVDVFVANTRMANWFDTVDCTDDGDHYTMILSHSLGLNNSKLTKALIENLFNAYGVKTESAISERTVFVKIPKNVHKT
jgi:hypothetical protein